MNDTVPASTAPIGAPRPLVKSIHTESASAAYAWQRRQLPHWR
jgi:hypothetical protein